MEAAMQTVNVGIPKSEMNLFRELAKKMGWKILSAENVLDSFIASRPKDADITEDEILEEVNKVRYHQ